jgi:glutamate 5-kinase
MNKKPEEGMSVHRLIVKVGTANLCDQSGKLAQSIFNDFARQITELIERGASVVVVSSGAIKSGRERMEDLGLDTACLHKKDLAGIGARHLLNKWGKAFENCKKEVGQVWVTFANWSNNGEKKSIQSSIYAYLKSGAVIPIVNELDVVSDREIKLMEKGFSENDRLAKMIAFLIGADAILFLTNEGGVYNENPVGNQRAKLYEEIDVREKPESIGISGGSSAVGTGGMMAKWVEAAQCANKGMLVAIAGNEEDVILRFVRGDKVGTKIGKKTKLRQ